jgi:DNA-directed RNA polymerase subunit RPC12/RpoP
MVAHWLKRDAPPGSTILEPLGASPQALLEAAGAGYRVLAACNNPVLAFETRLLAGRPQPSEFVSVLRELSDQRKGEERLESSIRSHYLTRCASCGAEIQASAYIWNRGESVPHTRVYTCPHCKDSGEHPITDEDTQRLQLIQRSEPMHRSRALSRVLGGSVDDRESVQAAIGIYPVRALYVLFTLLNRVEGMRIPPHRRDLLDAILLSLMYEGCAIWSWPEERARPRQLSIPPQYIEKNLWLEIDHAIGTWTPELPAVEFSLWPELPKANGVCIYPGRMRDLAQSAEKIKVDHMLCVFPRPNQAFWTLCSLWASWIWGQEKAGRFSPVIERKRFDWYWHTTALHAALLPAVSLAGDHTPVSGILPEPAAGLVNAVIQSTAISGMEVTGSAVMNDIEPVQLAWRTGKRNQEYKPVNLQKVAREAIRELLNEIAEPTEYIELHTAALCALADANAFPPSIQQLTLEKTSEVQAALNHLLADAAFLRRLDATAQDPESGRWWLAQPDPSRNSLADRLEQELLNWLQNEKKIDQDSLNERVFQRFSGYLTPPENLIQACLGSYATWDEPTRSWQLKDNETSQAREQDLQIVRSLVNELGKRLRVRQDGDHPLAWYLETTHEEPIYKLFISTTAILDWKAIAMAAEGCATIVLIPGSRAGLMKLKLERDPYLRELFSGNIHFLKFRTLRGIATRTDLTLEIWQVLIDSDPLSLEETTQLSMFI